MNNTNFNNTTMSSTGDLSGGDIALQPIMRTTEFMPLSQRPITPGQAMPQDNVTDKYVLEKQTAVPTYNEGCKVQKDLNMLIPESEEMMKIGLYQARHTNAISSEMKLLLENEKKVLNQMMKRCNKFSQLKEENKQTSEEWHNEHKKRLPKYESNHLKLISYLEDHHLNEEEMSEKVQQKILFEIVSKTTVAANNILVQLSMENTIINDIELSLLDLRKHSAVMLKQISEWLKLLGMQDQHQTTVLERWDLIRQSLKDLNNKSKLEEDAAGDLPGAQTQALIRCYEDRLQRVEQALMQCYGVSRTASRPANANRC